MKRNDFLPLAKPYISEDELAAANEVLRSGWWTTGPKVTEFEAALSDYLCEGDPVYAVGLNSCTAALHLALLACGIGKDDEVIVPTWTFAATAHVVEWVGAKAVLCDIEGNSLNIDLKKAEQLITDKTKAIMPVHIAGFPCDMEGIASLAKKYDLKVIEDAAHAIGTEYKGEKIGNFSDVTCFSFYATKNLAMGEGGAAVSKDKEIIEKIRKLGYFGINKEAFKRYEKAGNWRYDIEEMGYKCNLDSVHAAIGIEQLKKLDTLNARRRELAALYKKHLSQKIGFTLDSSEHYHTYHLFPILLPEGVERDVFIQAMKEENIGTSVHFIPLHLHSYYAAKNPHATFETADAIFARIVSIPMFPSMSDEDAHYVIAKVNAFLGE
ncbi:Glutamine--scyllo-inositol transaminase [Sulfuricurvum kujiense DSM 16994]|uniref:Glutamine--scyllo-inositol transaminase n=1 Tax=Sulfuricurvum kujiense (strain ATCC BAA-921 / DSM 16994 / JCM 11577 / YK-1) TaxID=709032 RepID=E4TY97_SULKY|nr:DegT/DnrJ/EryC1/StrS aminotransferase family protein [Sulfuricurvum kujiense]ADR35042.1 Glutamine--scyllo-inositol transaminase [Sulfuricurvum kujiense DSM 16994]